MKTQLNTDEVRQLLIFMADRVIAAEPILSEADRHLGDGDHGLGMARGFRAVKRKLEPGGAESIAQLFAAAGMAMLSTMGGASGALFGTLFRAGGKALEGRRASFDAAALADFLDAALAGIMARGGAKPGDKTMIDALHPAAIKARHVANRPLSEAVGEVAAACESGKEATKSMRAAIGRAKTLGDASIGYQDAGALSVAVMLKALRDYVLERVA
jgi:dihydroxyacetone kinase-like protein